MHLKNKFKMTSCRTWTRHESHASRNTSLESNCSRMLHFVPYSLRSRNPRFRGLPTQGNSPSPDPLDVRIQVRHRRSLRSLCCRTWIRTKIDASRGRSPTIRRFGKYTTTLLYHSVEFGRGYCKNGSTATSHTRTFRPLTATTRKYVENT